MNTLTRGETCELINKALDAYRDIFVALAKWPVRAQALATIGAIKVEDGK